MSKKNPYITKVGGPAFNILMVDDWLVGLFKTNNDIWRFLKYLGVQLSNGEEVPDKVYVFTVVITGVPEAPLKILETAKIVKMNLPLDQPEEKRKPYFVYTAIHNHQSEHEEVKKKVLTLAPDIMETLHESG